MTLIRSWVASANDAACPFPLNNLPFGVCLPPSSSTSSGGDMPRCCTAIGDKVVDLAVLAAAGLVTDHQFSAPALNVFMAAGPAAWAEVRQQLSQVLKEGSDQSGSIADALYPIKDVSMQLPFRVSEYTDFYAGRQHATNVGTMFRGAENALPPNWLHIPIGYNGRASTVVVSGTDVVRPVGQTKPADVEMPVFGPCKRLDIELEMGAVVGMPSQMGKPVSVAEADAMIFGYVLLNDWSARDLQAWEYQPLGPFQAKAFATSISPWVITKAALEPFRTSTPERVKTLLPYLQEPGPMLYDIALSVTMQASGAGQATTVCQTNYNEMYYSAAQQLAHHASSGCAMNTGDLLGSGTISGAEKESRGSLLELSWGGKEPFTLVTGETRSFIEDGDTLTLHGQANGDGYTVGFGVCEGTILPAVSFPN